MRINKALKLIKKINIDLINSISDAKAKGAAFYIIGEFCTRIPNSTEIISHFVDTFSNDDIVSTIKLQILNAAVKNFVNKPEEGEEIVKICLQKGSEESENPDVRDRAYIYWRLLETDPDIAKDMMISEKPPFEFNDDDNLIDSETVDDLIENMTNVSSVYLKKAKDIIMEEDMIKTEANGAEEEKEKPKEEEKTKESGKKKQKVEKKKEEQVQHNMDADLLGLDEEVFSSQNVPSTVNPVTQPPVSTNPLGDVFDIFNNMGGASINQSDPAIVLNIPSTIFQNGNYPTTSMSNCYSSPSLSLYSQFKRENNSISLGIFFQSQTPSTQCFLIFNKNSFGLSVAPGKNIVSITNNIAYYDIVIDNNNNNKTSPQYPFILDCILNYNNADINIKIPLDISVLFIEGWKLSGQPFVEFFQKNKDNIFNNNVFSYSKHQSEDTYKPILEKNNIVLSARQNKANPPTVYFSANICNAIPILIECWLKGGLNIKIIAHHEAIVPLVKEVLDKILN